MIKKELRREWTDSDQPKAVLLFLVNVRYVLWPFASSLRFQQSAIMAAQYRAVWANFSSRCFDSGALNCKSKVTMAMPLASSSLKSLQFSMASSFRPRTPQSVIPQWRIAKRIFLKCSIESSVTVIGEGNADVFSRMRELVDIAGGNAEGVDDASLMWFLRGFSLNIDEAAKAFAKHQEWEAFFKPKGFISEMEIPNELNAKKSYMQGRDKQGRPLSVILARNHVYNKEDFAEFLRFIVYSLDKLLAAASADGKCIAIIDLKGLGFKNLDSKAFISGFDIYQSHYPERIEKLYMVNAPLIFNGLWKVVSPFIKETTRSKIVFLEDKKVQETLLGVFDADQLPADYGGKAELVLLQDAVVPGWPSSASVPRLLKF